MRTVTVELDSETVDRIVVSQLSNALEGLEEDLKIKNRLGTFSSNIEEDDKIIRNHIRALGMVLNFFSNERYAMQAIAEARKEMRKTSEEEFDWMHPPGMRR